MSSKKSRKSSHEIKTVEYVGGYRSPILPVNCDDQKERFLRDGKLPEFVLRGSDDEVRKLTSRDTAVVRFEYLEDAERILDTVKHNYGDGKVYLDATFGPEITKEQASECVKDYISGHNLEGQMDINWCPGLACSATMMWQGPALKFNKPEARKYSLWLSDSPANTFLREQGITSLLHHEIGTHYFRMHNDGLQPWFSDRKRFRISPISCRKLGATEEGLASIHTVMESRIKYLWTAALLYYAACKAEDMSFRELFDHLEKYIYDKDQRWKHCIRVKRGFYNVNVPGGYGKDQCYFEGAVKLLRNMEEIDFLVLMAGKICLDEVERCKRLSRTDIIKLPHFMYDMDKYRKSLRFIAKFNGFGPVDIPKQVIPIRKSTGCIRKVSSTFQKHKKDTVLTNCSSKPVLVKNEKQTQESPEIRASNVPPVVDCTEIPWRSPQLFRYTHTPVHTSSQYMSCGVDSPQPGSQFGESLSYTRETSSKCESFNAVKSTRPKSSKANTQRAQSVCEANNVPQITHYSERLLHRESLHKTKCQKKKQKKRSFSGVEEVKQEGDPDLDNDDNYVRFGCLRTISRQD